MKMTYFFRINAVLVLFFCTNFSIAQNTHEALRAADKAYEANNLPVAEAGYRKALEKDNSNTKGNYNLGNTTYRQGHYDESIKNYQAAADAAKDRSTKARAYHNLGNALYKKGDFKQSVDAYKNALRQNPNDLETKRNLANAMRQLPPPPPQQQKQNQQNKNDKNQPKEKPKSGDQTLDQPQPDPKDEQPSKEQKQAGAKGQKLSKDEAQQLLDIMDQEEQKVQQKLKKAQVRNSRKSTKDW